MKIGIVGILNNPATSKNSHSAGWNLLVRDMMYENATFLKETDDWNIYDKIVICHGPNFKENSYNIIGGITESVIKRCNKLNNFKGIIESVDNFKPNDFYNKRKLDLKPFKSNIVKVSMPKRNNLVMGDSHSISVWPGQNYEILRQDGRTMYGFMKRFYSYDFNRFNKVIFYYGNIDVRFHLYRKSETEIISQIMRYINYARKVNATIVNLLPVESEYRKIPKSGQYKGKNFYGTQEHRQSIVKLCNKIMNQQYDKTLKWPKIWYEDIEYFENEIMEPRQSVHIRPKHYVKREELTLF